jgi:peptide deformylase
MWKNRKDNLLMIVVDPKELSTVCLQLSISEQEEVFLDLEREIRSHRDAIGLSAPQIGIKRRAFVYYSTGDVEHSVSPEQTLIVPNERTLIRVANPVLITAYQSMVDSEEGCLSVPGVQCLVRRYAEIVVKDDLGGEFNLTGEDSIVWQHETDHLDGILMTNVGVVIPKKIGRNDPCYCGSGKKAKRCHLK